MPIVGEERVGQRAEKVLHARCYGCKVVVLVRVLEIKVLPSFEAGGDEFGLTRPASLAIDAFVIHAFGERPYVSVPACAAQFSLAESYHKPRRRRCILIPRSVLVAPPHALVPSVVGWAHKAGGGRQGEDKRRTKSLPNIVGPRVVVVSSGIGDGPDDVQTVKR